jgi:hypothetical protein
MKKWLVIGISFISLIASAQLTPKKHIVRLYNDEVKEGTRLVYEYPIMQPSYFSLDGKHFDSENVAYFRNNHGYFANLSPFFGERSERYAMRIKNTGKIQLFEEIDISAYGGDTLLTDNPRRLATGEVWQFYAKNEGELKKGNYRNLKMDLADNPTSLSYLKSYKRMSILQYSLATAGASLVAYQFYSMRNEPAQLTTGLILGILMTGSTLLFDAPKSDLLWMAVDNYK